MEYRQLGKSQLEVSVVTMGCWAIAGDRLWGPQDEAEAIGALHAAVDVGINFFDSAEGYGAGRSEELIGKAFQGSLRDKVLIATKVSPENLRPADLRASCENSLRHLGMETVDVYYIHWPNWDIPIADTVGEMQRLKDEGKIRFVGCSNFGPRDLTEILALEHVEINQLAYNLLFRAIEYEIVPLCVERQVSIAPYSPLQHGILTGKFATLADIPDERARTRHFAAAHRSMARHGGPGAEAETAAALTAIREICNDAGLPMAQVALAWLLEQPGVATVIAGARNPAQVHANAEAAALKLPADMVAALTKATDPLKAALGPNPDMWQNDADSRMR
ncbi:MAG TPA: aldo/keto reductase [Anaerolineae bacterium]|nr:aldo/keto reductase [Anaerolineae bacterium]HQH37819.1 aldo/keto reductase [Anaerolineae bacterium]